MRVTEDLSAFFINEEFVEPRVSPRHLDRLLADGWRHFGPQFFRYNLAIYDNEIRRVIPLRVRLAEHRRSQSQARVARRNSDLESTVGPVAVTAEVEELFFDHRTRFRQHPPDSIFTFLSPDAAAEPCEVRQLSVRSNGRLIAASFFDVAENSISGIYAIFDPREAARRLGIFTLLAEIDLAAAEGKEFYYLGYCYNGSSFYDYKKQFHGTEAFDWKGEWKPVERGSRL